MRILHITMIFKKIENRFLIIISLKYHNLIYKTCKNYIKNITKEYIIINYNFIKLIIWPSWLRR